MTNAHNKKLEVFGEFQSLLTLHGAGNLFLLQSAVLRVFVPTYRMKHTYWRSWILLVLVQLVFLRGYKNSGKLLIGGIWSKLASIYRTHKQIVFWSKRDLPKCIIPCSFILCLLSKDYDLDKTWEEEEYNCKWWLCFLPRWLKKIAAI